MDIEKNGKDSWLDKVTNEEVLRRVNEDRQILNCICQRKHRWIGHVLRHGGLLREIIKGRMKGKQQEEEKNSKATWFGKWWWLCCTQTGSWGQKMETDRKDVKNLLFSRRYWWRWWRWWLRLGGYRTSLWPWWSLISSRTHVERLSNRSRILDSKHRMADHGSVKLLQLTTLLSAIRFHSTLATYTTVDEVKSLVFITIRYRLTSCAAAATRLRSSLTTHVHEYGSSLESVWAHRRRNRGAGAKRAVVPQYFMTIFVKKIIHLIWLTYPLINKRPIMQHHQLWRCWKWNCRWEPEA